MTDEATGVSEHQEIPRPSLIIRAMTPTEEMNYLWFVLKRVPFYQTNGYTFEIPDHPKFQEIASFTIPPSEVEKKAIEELFYDQIYKPGHYQPGIVALERERPKIEQAFLTMAELHRAWGFKMLPQYSLLLTRYGPGGKCDEDTGQVIMLTTQNGTFKRAHPAGTPIHEIIHIGINGIARNFRLTHWERERLVDLISSQKFADILPGYEMQGKGDSRIDPYITAEFDDLPKALANYTRDFPRD